MSNDAHDRAGSISGQAASPGRKRRLGRRLWFVWIGALILLAGFLLPPLVSLGRYKNRITQLMSTSFGRPVRLSSVELRLLPWPGFVLTDLRVEEDPAYGSEPVLYANTVTANIRLLSLWRGRLEIGSVSVDEASLNVVRSISGSWNLTPLFHTAAVQPGAPLHATALPYLEATNSRINLKYGAEKLPFSLINTDLSFWQEGPNEWRIRLRGQPARTDVSLDPADTGIVRVEASLDRAPALHDMPVHADVDWREAQLGQLSRLLVGSDEGWRGNLTGELHLDGTPGAAHVTTRLQATGVHRAEFVPLSPLDFDANCSFMYHYRRRALDDLVCNSPLGDGHLRLAGELQGSQIPELTAELDRIPAEAGLDLLRATRSGIAPSLQAAGSISGSLVYRAAETDSEPVSARARRGRGHAPALRGEPLRGALTVEGFALSGGSLSLPLRAEKFVLEPAPASALNPHEPVMLAGTAAFPAGGSAPLDVDLHLAMNGYQAEIHGETSIARAREIEKTAGMGERLIPDGLAGEPMAVDLRASGPWQLPDQNSVSGPTSGPETDTTDRIGGTATLRGTQWRSDLLANPVEIAEATLHFGAGELRWDPVDFSYGHMKARASIAFPQSCPSPEDTAGSPVFCVPQFQLQIGSVDAASAQAAFLGVPQKGTVLSDLLDRLHPATAPPWPRIDGTVKADAMVVGPVTLRQASMTLKIAGNGAEFSDLRASLLGGQVTAHGSVQWANGIQKQPAYSIEARCTGLNAAGIGQLLGVRGTGGPVDASGTASLSGFTEEQLANSAAGILQFDWRHGSISAAGARQGSSAKQAQTPLLRFDRWSGEARIANRRITLQKNQLIAGGRKRSVEAAQVTLSDPPEVEIRPGK